ncbi:DUF4249 family protein [Solitalea lacus]|uniref:DUF4249 family protein n=1 Tax=Solitalea lacus TaxID=2911172 RepID=UPI001EDB3D9A|nr:DUF4249 family protein [Solitalea lacus]UKJ07334.1 DUF4249 domain-containing protein [Solitalea lacus]
MIKKVLSKSILFLGLIHLASCAEEIDLTNSTNQQKLVVDGLITDEPGSYYVRLTYTFKKGEKAKGVNNALVVISNDEGLKDTLKLLNYVGMDKKGFYEGNKIKAKPNHTYYLEISVDGRKYTAESYMTPTPKIDSLALKHKEGDTGKPEQIIPIVYFKDSQEKNYYLFSSLTPDMFAYFGELGRVWPISILDDKLLKNDVNGFEMDDGESPDGLTFYPSSYGFDSLSVTFMCIDKSVYEFYQQAIKQINNNGQAYSPAPSTPKGNITNQAIGIFRAVSIKRAVIKW